MIVVYVDVKNKKHAEKTIKLLESVGYKRCDLSNEIEETDTICVFDDGEYQLLSGGEIWGKRIKPKEVMESDPVRTFMENNNNVSFRWYGIKEQTNEKRSIG